MGQGEEEGRDAYARKIRARPRLFYPPTLLTGVDPASVSHTKKSLARCWSR